MTLRARDGAIAGGKHIQPHADAIAGLQVPLSSRFPAFDARLCNREHPREALRLESFCHVDPREAQYFARAVARNRDIAGLVLDRLQLTHRGSWSHHCLDKAAPACVVLGLRRHLEAALHEKVHVSALAVALLDDLIPARVLLETALVRDAQQSGMRAHVLPARHLAKELPALRDPRHVVPPQHAAVVLAGKASDVRRGERLERCATRRTF